MQDLVVALIVVLAALRLVAEAMPASLRWSLARRIQARRSGGCPRRLEALFLRWLQGSSVSGCATCASGCLARPAAAGPPSRRP